MLASLPMMTDRIVAMFVGAAGVGFVVATTRSRLPWERLFLAGFSADAARFSYRVLIAGSNLGVGFASVVQMVLALGAFVAFVGSAGVATTTRRRLASLGMAAYVTNALWITVLGVRCGSALQIGCKQIPKDAALGLYLTAAVLLLVASARPDDASHPRTIFIGLAAFISYPAYRLFVGVIFSERPRGFDTLLNLITGFGALAAFIFAARSNAKERIFALALASITIPLAWTALVLLFGGS